MRVDLPQATGGVGRDGGLAPAGSGRALVTTPRRRQPPGLPEPEVPSGPTATNGGGRRRPQAAASPQPPAAPPSDSGVAARLLLQDLAFSYRQHPGLGLQLWLDDARDAAGVEARLVALADRQPWLARMGFGPAELWERAQAAACLVPPYDSALQRVGRVLLRKGGKPRPGPEDRDFCVLCLLSCSMADTTALDLKGLGLTGREIGRLTPTLLRMPRLRTLSLASNALTDDAAPSLSRLVAGLPFLAELDLGGNPMAEETAGQLAELTEARCEAVGPSFLSEEQTRHDALASLHLDAPLQARLGRRGAHVAGRIDASFALGRLGHLRLDAVQWADVGELGAALQALAPARNLWSLSLRIDVATPRREAAQSWWRPTLILLAQLPNLRVLGMGQSALEEGDLLAIGANIARLPALRCLAVGTPTPAWARDERGAQWQELLEQVMAIRGILFATSPCPSEPPPPEGVKPVGGDDRDHPRALPETFSTLEPTHCWQAAQMLADTLNPRKGPFSLQRPGTGRPIFHIEGLGSIAAAAAAASESAGAE